MDHTFFLSSELYTNNMIVSLSLALSLLVVDWGDAENGPVV